MRGFRGAGAGSGWGLSWNAGIPSGESRGPELGCGRPKVCLRPTHTLVFESSNTRLDCSARSSGASDGWSMPRAAHASAPALPGASAIGGRG
jgi:hypothetical protein